MGSIRGSFLRGGTAISDMTVKVRDDRQGGLPFQAHALSHAAEGGLSLL